MQQDVAGPTGPSTTLPAVAKAMADTAGWAVFLPKLWLAPAMLQPDATGCCRSSGTLVGVRM